jgi:hypothetical protein
MVLRNTAWFRAAALGILIVLSCLQHTRAEGIAADDSSPATLPPTRQDVDDPALWKTTGGLSPRSGVSAFIREAEFACWLGAPAEDRLHYPQQHAHNARPLQLCPASAAWALARRFSIRADGKSSQADRDFGSAKVATRTDNQKLPTTAAARGRARLQLYALVRPPIFPGH